MNHVAVVAALHVRSIPESAAPWLALGYELGFALEDQDLVGDAELDRATFARLDAPSPRPISVFLDTEGGAREAVLHLMLGAPAEVDEAARRLRSADQDLEQEPTDQPWGMRDLVVCEASGHRLVIGAALEEGTGA